MRHASVLLRVGILMLMTEPLTAAVATNLSTSLAALRDVGKEGEGHRAAQDAWKVVASASADQLPTILAAMPDDNALADNWIRAAVEAIAERTLAADESLPVEALDAYVADRSHSARSRRLAYEWLTRADPEAQTRWIPRLLDDPSLELRREAVAHQLDQGQAAVDTQQQDTAIAAYVTALQYARDIDQIEAAAEALRKLDQPVDLPTHFGFLTRWYLTGPFDNTDMTGFDRVYPPEESIDLDAEYAGKEVVVRWTEAETEDDYGKLDLNKLIGKANGVTAYGVTFFESPAARPAELRLGCINANKVWLNGELLTANNVYHAGSSIDQYVGRGQLRAGKNVILVKICQNEQTESWAQDWEFQLRVCDQLGTAILPANSAASP